MTKEQFDKLDYVLKHDPIIYVVERRWLIFWVVKNIDGSIIHAPSIWKFLQVARKDFYNHVFSYGYSRGCSAVIKSLDKL